MEDVQGSVSVGLCPSQYKSTRRIKEAVRIRKEGRQMTILELGRGQLHAKPHVRPISCHIASLLWQEPEEEMNKVLLMKVSGRD